MNSTSALPSMLALYLLVLAYPLCSMSKTKSLSELRSLGPKSQEMLVRAGITTVAQLRSMGSVAAYAQVRKVDGKASLNLLWALESALSGEPWQQVAKLHRTSLLLALDEHESNA